MKKVGMLFIFIAVLLTGCGPNTQSTVANTTTEVVSTPTVQYVKHFDEGQPILLGNDWEITETRAQRSQGDGSVQLSPGYDLFLIVPVSIKNISSQEQNITGTLNFELKDDASYDPPTPKPALLKSGTLPLPSGQIAPGQTKDFDLVYEVRGGDLSFNLSVKKDSLQAIWDILL